MILFLLLIIHTPSGKAQVQVYNRSLTDSTLPYFYIGADNALEVDWKGLKPERHLISISNGGGSITMYAANKYVVRVSNLTDSCLIRITNTTHKTVLHKIYKVRRLPDFMVTLDGLRDTTVTRERILKNPVLTLTPPGCFYRLNSQVTSFNMSVLRNGNVVEATSNGNRFSPQQINLLLTADKNNVLYIDNIRATGPDGRSRKLPSIIIYYKDLEE